MYSQIENSRVFKLFMKKISSNLGMLFDYGFFLGKYSCHFVCDKECVSRVHVGALIS
jgi:hypothetical protein